MTRVVLLAGFVAAVLVAPAQAARAPQPFSSCAALARYASAHQPPAVARPGLPTVTPQTAAGADPPAPDTSTTNIQEAGVDEPDIVKVDGSKLLAIAGGTLYAIDARAATPHVAGSVALPAGYDHELLVHGDRALVISRGRPSGGPIPLPAQTRRVVPPIGILPYGPPTTILSELDLSAMRVVRTLTFDGTPVGARLTGATARVVVSSAPWRWVRPLAHEAATGWIPTATLTGRRGTARHRLVGCRHVLRPPAFAGAGLLTVLTIDLDRGLPAVDADALMTDAQTIYASPGSLYVATRRWDPSADTRTEIHRFDTSQADRTAYRSTGSVPGHLLDQFSLSERDGVLRAASTTEPLHATGARQGESFVTTLRDDGARLAQVGQVGGLGRGERIYAVRFEGPVGYVVTFRRTDPLYTVDLSDPAAPRVAGELALLGYSAYLHPIGDGLLLGVGQDATADGRVTGLQLSLFDVSDPARPQRVAHRALGTGSSSDAEYDHHAFLWWPATRLAVLPVSQDGFTGALGFHVGRAGIQEAGRIAHAGASPRRTAVVGSRLFSVSDAGVQVSALATLADEGWIALGQA